MNVTSKIELAKKSISFIATHDDEDAGIVLDALKEIFLFAKTQADNLKIDRENRAQKLGDGA